MPTARRPAKFAGLVCFDEPLFASAHRFGRAVAVVVVVGAGLDVSPTSNHAPTLAAISTEARRDRTCDDARAKG